MSPWMLVWVGFALGAAAPQAPQQTATLRVIVQNEQSQPVANVEVSLRSVTVTGGQPIGVSVETGDDGVAEFQVNSYGGYTVQALHNGLPYIVRAPTSGGSSTVNIRVGGVLSGRVRTHAGEPAAGVNVWAGAAVLLDGRKTIREWLRSETGTDGTYRIPITATAEYFIRVGSNTAPSLTDTYYPGTHDVSLARPVLARAGSFKGGLDFDILESRTYSVSGRLSLLPADAPFYGASPGDVRFVVVPLDSAIQGVEIIRTDVKIESDGTFMLDGVPPGRWEVLAEIYRRDIRPLSFEDLKSAASLLASRDPTFRYAVGRDRIDITDQDRDGLVLRVNPSDVRGRIVGLPDGFPAPNIRLVPKGYFPTTGAVNERSDKGEFAFRGIPPATYAVHVSLPPGYYVASMRVGSSLIHETDGTFEVGNGEVGPIEITVAKGAGSIEGTLRSLAPGRDLDVTASSRVVLGPAPPREGNLSLYRTTTIAATTGTFTFTDVPPGEYRVFAFIWPPGQTAEILANYATFSTPVTVREGSVVRVDAYLIPEAP